MYWFLFTILAIIFRAVYSLGTRLLSRDVRVSPITQSFFLTAVSGFLSLLCVPFLGGINLSSIPNQTVPILILVTASVFGNIIYFKGQKNLDTGLTQIAFSSILVWGAVLSVLFLGSKFSLLQIFGMMLMLAALIMVQYRQKKNSINSGITYIVFSAVLFAVFQVFSAGVSKLLTTGTYLMVTYFGTAAVIMLLYYRQIRSDFRKLHDQLKNTFTKTLFASGASLMYFIFSYIAYRHAPDRGVVVVLLTAQAVLSVIFGIIFLKEKENQNRKLIAGILAFIAGIMIKS